MAWLSYLPKFGVADTLSHYFAQSTGARKYEQCWISGTSGARNFEPYWIKAASGAGKFEQYWIKGASGAGSTARKYARYLFARASETLKYEQSLIAATIVIVAICISRTRQQPSQPKTVPHICDTRNSVAYRRILTYLLKVFRSVMGDRTRPGRLINHAATCYLNSMIQALYMTPEFRDGIYNTKESDAGPVTMELQKLFRRMQKNDKPASTVRLASALGTEVTRQRDVQEFWHELFETLENEGSKQKKRIEELYMGEFKDYVVCQECGEEDARTSRFLDIPLVVRPFGSQVSYGSIEESLAAFVQQQLLDGDNQSYCTTCEKKCNAMKGLGVTKLPYILTFHLMRFEINYTTKQRVKVNDRVTFPEYLDAGWLLEHGGDADKCNTVGSNIDKKETQLDEFSGDLSNEKDVEDRTFGNNHVNGRQEENRVKSSSGPFAVESEPHIEFKLAAISEPRAGEIETSPHDPNTDDPDQTYAADGMSKTSMSSKLTGERKSVNSSNAGQWQTHPNLNSKSEMSVRREKHGRDGQVVEYVWSTNSTVQPMSFDPQGTSVIESRPAYRVPKLTREPIRPYRTKDLQTDKDETESCEDVCHPPEVKRTKMAISDKESTDDSIKEQTNIDEAYGTQIQTSLHVEPQATLQTMNPDHQATSNVLNADQQATPHAWNVEQQATSQDLNLDRQASLHAPKADQQATFQAVNAYQHATPQTLNAKPEATPQALNDDQQATPQALNVDQQAIPQSLNAEQEATPQALNDDEQATPQALNIDQQATPQALKTDKQVTSLSPHNMASKNNYELFAVLVHAGGTESGHYTTYVKSRSADQWYFCDGTIVNKASRNDIKGVYGGETSLFFSPKSAYMLMYRRQNEGSTQIITPTETEDRRSRKRPHEQE